MPELPDVETYRRYLNATALHKAIEAAEVRAERVLKGVTSSRLERILNGSSFEKTHRHGKYLFIRLNGNGWLVLHFGMTGFLRYYKQPGKKPSHARVHVRFSNGYHLSYDCRRRLGEVNLCDDPQRFIREQELGPDALAPDLAF